MASHAGAIDVDKRAEGWRQQGYSGFDATARPLQANEMQADRGKLIEQGTVLPVVREYTACTSFLREPSMQDL